MFKRQKWQARILSFLLALIMVLQDGAAMTVRAEAGDTGTAKTVQEAADASGKDTGKEADAAGENGKDKDTGTPEGEDGKADAGDKKTDDKGTADKTEDPDDGKADGKGQGTDASDPASADTGKDEEGAGTETGADAGTDGEDAEKDAASDMEAGADVSGNDIPADISGNDPVLREPEDYYPVEEEDYGELVAYDAYSRTYLTGEAPAAAGKATPSATATSSPGWTTSTRCWGTA